MGQPRPLGTMDIRAVCYVTARSLLDAAVTLLILSETTPEQDKHIRGE